MSIHIPAEKGSIAPIVLMPGDPLRAKYIAENWLSNIELVSSTRNIYFYTGTYKDVRMTIGASGMGCPSIGIYSYELYNEFDVESIIRIGTAGSYHENIKLYDLINVDLACSESSFAKFAFGYDENVIAHQGNLFDSINETASRIQLPIHKGNIHSSDIFYRKEMTTPAIATAHNCLAVEMESFALFANAAYLGKKAACVVTISDVIPTHEKISADAREKSLIPMIELVLETAVLL